MEQRNIISKLVNLGWGQKGVKVRAHIPLPPSYFSPRFHILRPHQQKVLWEFDSSKFLLLRRPAKCPNCPSFSSLGAQKPRENVI